MVHPYTHFVTLSIVSRTGFVNSKVWQNWAGVYISLDIPGKIALNKGILFYKENPMKQVEVYTDGACSGNPGPGGWGAVLRYPLTAKCTKRN